MLWSEAPNKIKYTQKCDPFHNIRDIFFKKKNVWKWKESKMELGRTYLLKEKVTWNKLYLLDDSWK